MLKSTRRQRQAHKHRYGMRGNGAGADRRPDAVRNDEGLTKRLMHAKDRQSRKTRSRQRT